MLKHIASEPVLIAWMNPSRRNTPWRTLLARAIMTAVTHSEEDRQRVFTLGREIGIGFLTTHGDSDRLYARPVAVASTFLDGKFWVMTKDGMPKLDELAARSQVLLAFSDLKKQRYVSLSGTAEILTDPAKARLLWDETQRLWFPEGPQEADLRLIAITPQSAALWDRPASRLPYVFHYLKTLFTRRSPGLIGENKIVAF